MKESGLSGCLVLQGWGKTTGSDCKKIRGFFLGLLNVLKLTVVIAAQLCDYTKTTLNR